MVGSKFDRIVGKKWWEMNLIVNQKEWEIEFDVMIRIKW